MSKNCKKYTQSQYPMRDNGATLGQFRTKCFTRNTMAETVVLFCILYCGTIVTECVSDSLAQTTLKSQRLSGANSYKKIRVKHYDGITYRNNGVKSY